MQKPSIEILNLKLYLSFIPLIHMAVIMIMLGVFSGKALAGKEDFKLPIEIDSDKQQIDLKENVTIFDTNVSVSQGTLHIQADYMKVTGQDQKGYEVYIATGHPATYRQELDDGKPIIAQANTIRYEVATRSLTLIGNAEIRQNNTIVQSEVIRYDLKLQTLQAEGSDGTPVKSVFSAAEQLPPPASPR